MRLLPPEKDPLNPAYYEGLVFVTAQKIGPIREMDFEDVQQELRIKVFHVLQQFNPERSKMTVQAYVYGCLYNRAKDLMKRNRAVTPRPLFIEDLCAPNGVSGEVARERFEGRYLADRGLFESVEVEPLRLPSTLDNNERIITVLLFLDYSREEVADELALPRRQVDLLVKSIKAKMADWRPTQLAEAA